MSDAPNMAHCVLPTPVGNLLIQANDVAITKVAFTQEATTNQPLTSALLKEAARQMQAWFEGKLFVFDLPMQFHGTDFQQKVWQALMQIPYSETISYQQLAMRIQQPEAIRAVGAANARNPLAILIPCHRVIGAKGQLTGYAGGLSRKRWLLAHEANFRKHPYRLF